MVFDSFTILAVVALWMLAFLSSYVFNPFRRKPVAVETESIGDEPLPPLSVVIPVHDNAEELERNLPVVLSQDYPAGFEVIVVDESSSDETEDVLKRLKNYNPHLYVTFIPDSSHYLSRRKLSLTLGVKAAKNEWIVFLNTNECPESDQWLKRMAAHCSADTDLVIGHTAYSKEAKTYYRFYRLLTASCFMSRASKGMAYAVAGCNLMMRKSVFMAHNGFLANLKYLRGEYDFIANEYSQKGRVAVAMEGEALVIQDSPSPKTWLDDNLFYMETRNHLVGRRSYRLENHLGMVLLYGNYLVQALALAGAIYLENWLLVSAVSVALIVTVVVRLLLASKAMKLFGEDIPLWKMPFMELRVVWTRLRFLLRYHMTDRYDFIRR